MALDFGELAKVMDFILCFATWAENFANYLPVMAGKGGFGLSRRVHKYLVGEATRDYHMNPWVLYMPTPSGGINFDRFMYFPLQNYPLEGYGGYLQLIGDWAYVHE